MIRAFSGCTNLKRVIMNPVINSGTDTQEMFDNCPANLVSDKKRKGGIMRCTSFFNANHKDSLPPRWREESFSLQQQWPGENKKQVHRSQKAALKSAVFSYYPFFKDNKKADFHNK